MADTPQQRADEDHEDDVGTTPDAPQTRTDESQESGSGAPTDTDESAGLKTPVTREEVERRQLGDEVDGDE